MALIILVENLVNAIDNGQCAVGIFLDFHKAFDTVDYCIILDKLYFYGMRSQAFDWFSSYLHNSQRLINYYGCESDFPKGLFLDSCFSYCLSLIHLRFLNISCQSVLLMIQISLQLDTI